MKDSRERTFVNQKYDVIAADASGQLHGMETTAKAEQKKLWKDEGDEYDGVSEKDDSSWPHDSDCDDDDGDDDHGNKKEHYGHKSK